MDSATFNASVKNITDFTCDNTYDAYEISTAIVDVKVDTTDSIFDGCFATIDYREQIEAVRKYTNNEDLITRLTTILDKAEMFTPNQKISELAWVCVSSTDTS